MSKKKIVLAVGILSMNLLLMSGTIVGSAIAAIAKSFPTEPISKVQMVSTIYQFGQVAATLLFAWLTYHLTRKNLGLISTLIVGLSGLLPVFYNTSLNVILACMVCLGFGLGLISNIGPVLLQEHFKGEERATVMGWAIGFSNLGMMAFTAIGGVLGSTNWRNLFWVYIVSFLIMIAVYVLVPQDQRVQATPAPDGHKKSFLSAFKGINGYVYAVLLVTFIMSIIMTAFMANESIVLSLKGHGTAYTALITAVGNIGGIATAVLLTYIRKLTKHDTLAWGFVAFCLSFVFIFFFNNFVMHILGNVFSGMGIVMINATIPFNLSILANQKQFPVVISMNTLVSSLAGGIAPVLLGLVHISAGNSQYIFGIIASVAVGILLLVTRFGNKVEKAAGIQETPSDKSTAQATKA